MAKKGAARTPSTSADPASADQGLRITTMAHRCQNPASLTVPGSATNGSRRRSTARPATASTAGRNVTAAMTATATTLMDPIAMERKAWMSTRNSPARATTTVAPDSATARPELAIGTLIASGTSRPWRSSSRKRVTTNRA